MPSPCCRNWALGHVANTEDGIAAANTAAATTVSNLMTFFMIRSPSSWIRPILPWLRLEMGRNERQRPVGLADGHRLAEHQAQRAGGRRTASHLREGPGRRAETLAGGAA